MCLLRVVSVTHQLLSVVLFPLNITTDRNRGITERTRIEPDAHADQNLRSLRVMSATHQLLSVVLLHGHACTNRLMAASPSSPISRLSAFTYRAICWAHTSADISCAFART